MKKVLFISYYFPPAGGSAVQRALKFVKYLPKSNWQPVVLTARESDHALTDDTLYTDIPENVKIIRSAAPDLYRQYTRFNRSGDTAASDLSAIAAHEKSDGSFIKNLGLWIRNAFFIPDARVGWLPFALIKGFKAIRAEHIDVIFTTSPPFTTALVGLLLKKMTGLPWVSDYRDPWTQAYYYFKRPFFSAGWEECLERICLRHADRIISINQYILDDMRNKTGSPDPARCAVLPNGFDPEDFRGIQPYKSKKFTLVYTGTQNSKMHSAPLLEAVNNLTRTNPSLGRKIEILFIGRISDDVLALYRKKKWNMLYEHLGQLPHSRALSYSAGANMLILLIPDYPDNRLIMTGKLFEYLNTGNPILCLTNQGIAADIISEANAGFCINPAEPHALMDVLADCLRKWSKNRPLLKGSHKKDVIARYNRQKITKYLARIFDRVLE